VFYYRYENCQIFPQQFARPRVRRAERECGRGMQGRDRRGAAAAWDGGCLNVRFGWLGTQFLDYVQLQQALVSRGSARSRSTASSELRQPAAQLAQFRVSFVAEQACAIGVRLSDSALRRRLDRRPTRPQGRRNPQQGPPVPPGNDRAARLAAQRTSAVTPDGRLEVAFWVRNIENKAYKTFAFDGSSFQETTIYFVGDPRTYGGTISFTF
jgi:hypothetical protein